MVQGWLVIYFYYKRGEAFSACRKRRHHSILTKKHFLGSQRRTHGRRQAAMQYEFVSTKSFFANNFVDGDHSRRSHLGSDKSRMTPSPGGVICVSFPRIPHPARLPQRAVQIGWSYKGFSEKEKKKGKVKYMACIYHLRLHRRDLDLPSWEDLIYALKCELAVIHSEGQSDGLHYHIYLKSTAEIKTLRNRLISATGIPKGKRGEENKYYMLKIIPTESVSWKDLDLQKFTLGYTAKGGTLVYSNMPTDLLEQAKAYYMDKTGQSTNSSRAEIHQVDIVPPESIESLRIPLEAQASPLARREKKEELTKAEQQYERYKTYLDDHLDKTDKMHPEERPVLPIYTIRYWSVKFFYSESTVGLLPQKSHINRFISSYSWYFMKNNNTGPCTVVEQLSSNALV